MLMSAPGTVFPPAFLRLPFAFDVAALLPDLRTCEELGWTPHFNTADYAGDWTSIALRSVSGSAGDISSRPDASYRDTPLLTRCPAFSAVVHGFACELESVRLLKLAPGSVIKEHTDVQAGYRYGFFRIHIPLATSEQVDFRIAGRALPMRAGECWYGDFSLPHSVHNRGSEARVNLVIDGRRNAWSDAIFAEAGYDFAAEREALRPDPATQERIIAELRNMPGETAQALIRQLQAQR